MAAEGTPTAPTATTVTTAAVIFRWDVFLRCFLMRDLAR